MPKGRSHLQRKAVKTPPPIAVAGSSRRLAGLILPIFIVLAGLAAYGNSLSMAFVLDDNGNLVNDLSIRSFSRLRASLFGPPWRTFNGRPLVFLSFALNYRLHGLNVGGYHIFNLAVHILAALVLWGVLRRTFRRPAVHAELGGAADVLAAIISLVWVVHPLTTAAVTYISQRAESMMAVFYFLTLYCFIRGVETDRCSGKWHSLAVLCCLLGLACKEPIATAPLLILLYDRTLVAGSFAVALRQRRWLYLGLVATWILPAMIHSFHPYGPSAALNFPGFSCWDNLKTQSRSVVLYLRLCLWPDPLIIFYGPANIDVPILRSFPQYARWAGIVLALLGLTLWAIWHRLPIGVAGAWFFLVLGPSSSIIVMPMEVIAEQRAYVPLVAVIICVVTSGFVVIRRMAASAGGRSARIWKLVGWAVCLAIVLTLIGATRRRNEDFRSPLTLWRDTAKKMPRSATALGNLGIAECDAGAAEAEEHLRAALILNPAQGASRAALGRLLEQKRRRREAIEQYALACKYSPSLGNNFILLADALAAEGRPSEAIAVLRTGAAQNPWHQGIHASLGVLLVAFGDTVQGQTEIAEAIRMHPDAATAHLQIGQKLVEVGNFEMAMEHLHTAVALAPDDPQPHSLLAVMLRSRGHFPDAAKEYRAALKLAPENVILLNDLAWIEATCPEAGSRNGADAIAHAEKAMRLAGRGQPAILDTLAAAYAEAGRFDQAVATAQEALALAESGSDEATARDLRARLDLYRAGRPYRDIPAAPTTAPGRIE